MFKEDLETEYKLASGGLPDDLWETYSAFANTVGGKIVLGIKEDDEGQFTVEGIKNSANLIDDFWNTIRSTEKVSMNILNDSNINVEMIENKSVIVIDVPEAEYKLKPIMVKAGKKRKQWVAYKRLGSGDREATRDQLGYMYANANNDLDSSVIDGFDIDDLNMNDVERYKKKVIEATREQRYEKMSVEDFLREIGALKRKRPSKEYGLTLGGLLFFGKYSSIRDQIPSFQLDYFRKNSALDTDWLDRISTGDMSYSEMNVYSFYTTVYERMTSLIPEAFLLDEASERLPYRADLSIVIRESLVNMLMHAYYGSDINIKVTEYQDYIEFYNPGDMRIFPEDFIVGGTSMPRNQTLAVLFRKIGIAEKAGSGGPRIFDVVHKYNLRTPEIITTDEDTLIRIWKTDVISSYKGLPLEERNIVEYLVSQGEGKRKSIIEYFGMTAYSFSNSINNLIDKGIVEKVGSGSGVKYLLAQDTVASTFSNKKLILRLEDLLRRKRTRK